MKQDIKNIVLEIDKPNPIIPNSKSNDVEVLNNKTIKKDNTEFSNVLNKLKIDEFYTKFDKRQKKYNKFINSIVPEKDFNYMADLIIMPKTSEGFKYLLVVNDLATNLFDVEPMKNKTAKETLQAYKNIIKRKILTLPEISFKTDNGTEFKGEFDAYLKDNKILHKLSKPYNHKQQAPIEGLNKTITRILMNYLSDKELELDKSYNNWTDILPQVRQQVNTFRERDLDKLKKYQSKHYHDSIKAGKPDYNIGDFVHYRIFAPVSRTGEVLNDGKWRSGDRRISVDARKITDIIYMPDDPYYRYVLFNMPNVSFSKYDLKASKQKDNTYIVKKIIGKKVENKKIFYLVFWKGYLKKDSTWESKDKLIQDGVNDYIDAFEKELKDKKKKKK